jgi:hypothetical protein
VTKCVTLILPLSGEFSYFLDTDLFFCLWCGFKGIFDEANVSLQNFVSRFTAVCAMLKMKKASRPERNSPRSLFD